MAQSEKISRKGLLLGVVGAAFMVGAILAFGVFEVHTAFYDREVDEPFDAKGLDLIAAGAFHPVAHQAEGRAEVYRASDGSYRLRFVDFDVDNGPTLRVRALAVADAQDSELAAEAEHIDVGPLKGNVGNQAYELPADFDPAKHASVSVWCERFSVNFTAGTPRTPGATAPLQAQQGATE